MALITNPPARPTITAPRQIGLHGHVFDRTTDDSPHNVVRIWEGSIRGIRIILTEDLSDFAAGRVVWDIFSSNHFAMNGGTVWAGRGKHADLDAVDALPFAASAAIEAAVAE